MDGRKFQKYLETEAAAGRLCFKNDHPASECCTFRIGGDAAYAVYPLDAKALAGAVRAAVECGVRSAVLGNGSNILFDDGYFDGALIFTTQMAGLTVENETITAECGVSLTKLAVTAQKNALTGFEFAYGIPGTAGGAVYMNAGAFGGEMSGVVAESEALNPADGLVRRLDNDSHGFSYRHSAVADSGEIILASSFALKRGDPDEIKAKMDGFMSKRHEKQPLEYPSAGSVFKRCGELFTAKLIDDAGLKGRSVGGARVSEKHAGFIINAGGATSSDVRTLIGLIREHLYELHGVKIECEIKFFSFETGDFAEI